MKNAVNVKIKKARDYRIRYYWQVNLVGASGRIDTLCNLYRHSDRFGSYYDSDRYSEVFVRLADWKQWAEKNMTGLAPDFVMAERCGACAIAGDCPNPCPIRENGF